jgi:leucine dehydrogenase
MTRVAGIGDTVRTILDAAEERGVTPLQAAEELAASRLRAGAEAGVR